MNRFSPRPFRLSPQRRALLEALLQHDGLEASVAPAISRRPQDASLPLSFAQQRFWFLEQWEPGSAVSTIARAFSLRGALNLATLEQSLGEIVQRHEALRTTFVLRDGQPEQVISPIIPEILSFVDLGDLAEDERAVQVERLAHEQARRPFDLARGPLLRASLLYLSLERHELLLTLHHSACDGWSLNLFLRELSILYQAGVSGQPSLLPELPLQYADYAFWQHQWLQGAVLAHQLAYWRQRLEGAPVVLDLPTDHPRPAVQTFRGSHAVFPLPQELAQAVREMSQRAGATLFMSLLTAFAALLLRYSRQEDFVIGTPLANRPQRVLEGLIGCFANTLALRLDVSGRPDFATLLDRVRETCLEAYAHQDLPFEKLIEALAPERAMSHTPLFQVMFALQDQSWNTLHLAGLSVQEPEIVPTGTARVDLLLTVVETYGGLSARFEYRTDLFEAATIARMANHFQLVLEGMVRTPRMRLDEVPLLSKAEQHLLLRAGNAPSQPPADSQSQGLHQLIETQVARTPDALALVWGEHHLTYHELNRRANQLAHHLLGLGAGPEHLVGVCLPRSLDLVIALFAILKTGGAYLPLDPGYPAERLSFMLQDSQASLLLTPQQIKEHAGALPSRSLTISWETLNSQRTENPGRSMLAESVAYVIYTSGSTGQPKGVALTHRSASALLSWARHHFSSQQLARVLASTSICFDLSIFELWVPLGSGGTVLLAEDVLQGFAWATEQAVTLLNTVPSALAALLSLGGLPASLTSVNLAGEVLSAHLVQQTYARGMVQQVSNLYGPSEDTTYSTWAPLAADTSDPVSIGRPIANTEVYLLDAQGQLVPIGVAGELCLGGTGLARGYLRQPALTAERFVPHPWSQQSGQRLYRTGDLARYRPDGSLEFVGRADTQVKLRGYRIELGEIEAVVRQHPLVREAVVLSREDVAGEPYLVGYVIPQEQPLAPEGMRDWLARKVPDYMVPTAWVVLERLPLSPNGKVDRRALPAPGRQRSKEETHFTTPRTAAEEVVAGIWAEVLRLEHIGIHDNFFEIGGHSLLATQVVARLREALHWEVPLRSLFEAPTVAKLAQHLERTLLGEARWSAPSLHSLSRPDKLPLSFAQQRLWFLEQWAPGTPTYNLPVPLRLSGRLWVSAFVQALGEIVRRHEILRTAFTVHESSPVQWISAFQPPSLAVVDLNGLPAGQRETLALQLVNQEMQQPFDLAQGPLWRVGLVRLGEEEHMLWWTLHHSIVDGWSLGLLVRELSTLYQAIVQEQPSPLPEPEVQYADYALWQRRWLSHELLETPLAYWKQHLQDAPPWLELPTDRPRPAVQTFAGDHYRFALPPELARALVITSRQEGVTLFMTLLAAWQTLLFRYSGQEDLLVGTPIANRTHTQLEEIIGCFVNTLVLRGDLSGDPSFRTLLRRVREMALQAYAHQDVPFEHVVEALHPQRELSHTPLFQVMFVLQNAPGETFDLPGLRLHLLHMEPRTARFELTLVVQEVAQGLEAMLEYNTDLFEAATIARMARHWQTLLQAIVANPELPLSRLSLLTEAEREQLLVARNQTGTAYPREQSLSRLFEVQVERSPEAIAIIFEQEQLTYLELNDRANRLAHHLSRLGIGPEVRVGLCIERSIALVVAMLAVIKAGGAYVPLDPSYPSERLTFMLEDAQVALLLTQELLLETLPVQSQVPLICLDAPAHAQFMATQPVNNLAIETFSTQLAYLIYTSGSTGLPKAVAIPQQAVTRLVRNTNYVQMGTSDSVAQASNASFDAITFEVWGALLNGGRLVGVSKDVALSPEVFASQLREQGITVLFLTTALFNQIARTVPDAFRSIRHLLFGGEAVEPRWVRAVLKQGRPERLLHVYGPTENTTYSSWYLVQEVEEGATTIPIGGALANTQIYVLDAQWQPTPVGVVGELYLGGEGLARGYLNRPELTAERFIAHPYSKKPGERLYRTGDLVRWRADGALEFVGRRDGQVKVRGFRIELGEIEEALSQHPGVREAVVVALEEVSGSKRLVAYVIGQPGPGSQVSELRRYLQGKLPSYMVPSAIVQLESWPLTANGKLDRQALPVPDQTRPDVEKQYVVPRTPVEEILASIWGQVLGLEQVGIHDNFFELGGHSLLATQVISRVRDIFQVEMPLRALFATPTIANLAEQITIKSQPERGLQVPPLRPFSREENMPLSFGQQRLWVLNQLEPGNATYNIPLAVRLTGLLSLSVLEQSLNEIIRRHEALRTIFIDGEVQPVQNIVPPWDIALFTVDLRGIWEPDREIKVQRLIAEEALQPFDLTHGPLLRASVLRLGAEEHILLLTVHHIIADGWSMGVLMREISTLYPAFLAGGPSPLPELPIQYPDYALWQKEHLQHTVFKKQLDYWEQQLQGCPSLLELRTDRARPPAQTFRGAYISLRLSRELSESLKALSRQQETTLFMTLLAAFKVLLSRSTGQEDIVVGAPVAGRNRSELEQLIGFFPNTLVLRTDLSGHLSFLDVLERVRTVTLDAYAHQDVPFEHLLQALRVERSLSYTPLFQILFNMLNLPNTAIILPGLSVDMIPPAEASSKFDLTLYVKERQEAILLELVYNADLFNHERMVDILEQLHTLLKQIVKRPQASIWSFSLVTSAAQAILPDPTEVLNTDWYGAIHTQISHRARLVPERVAIMDAQTIWTYKELEARSNQLAQYLRAGGIQPQDRVAIYGYRNTALVCAVLGVLKAGAVLSVLDPAYPAIRLLSYVEIMKPRGWIQVEEAGMLPQALEEYIKTVPGCCRLEISSRMVDPDYNPLNDYPAALPEVLLGPEDPAWIAFTSGSTGKPKGVVGKHGSLTHFLPWQAQMFEWREDDHFSMLSGLSHDPLQRDIFSPLWFGATLCIPTPEDIGTPGQLATWMYQQQVSVMHLTPAMIQVLTQSISRTIAVPSLRLALILGEVATRDDVLRLRQLSPTVTCVNTYGATETQRALSHFFVPHEIDFSEERSNGELPVGRGLKDVQLLVLHHDLQRAGFGEMGEIYVRSPHVASGYLDDEVLTQQKFLLNPFTNSEGDILYKTGDLGCYLLDGNVEFLGRRDTQVKLRGFRIELGEIEVALRRFPAVRDCLVMVREDSLGEKRLVAYIVLQLQQRPSVSELRSYILARLPDYMLPSVFILLEAFPVTPNGKLDRRMLPAPDGARPELDEAFVTPRNPIEELLAGIWSDVLRLENIGIYDPFFQIGGHSLLATRVLARMRDTFQVDLPLRALFESPTVAGLAEYIQTANQTIIGLRVPPLQPSSREGNIPLSFAQQRLWFLDQFEAGSPFYNMPAAIRLQGMLSVVTLERSLNQIVQRHEVLRTTFSSIEGKPVQHISPTLQVRMPIVDLSSLSASQREAQVLRLAAEEAASPFDLTHGPLLRVCLLRVGQEESVLLLSLHHIVFDGWSIDVLLRELSALYTSFSIGDPSPLPALPVQYADYTLWQRQWLQDEVLENQLSYWRQQLHGAPLVLELPTDRPRLAVLTSRGARYTFTLPGALSEGLTALSRREGVTLFMTLLAAWQTLLWRYSGQDDLLVGTPIANRTHPQIEGLIGCFVNTLVLRADLSGDPSFRALLRRVREVCLGAYAHQDLPFEQLVEALQPQRDLSHTPLFQVLFVLQNTPMEAIDLPGLLLRPLDVERMTARFDLGLSLRETATGLVGVLEYNSDLFEAATIARMAGHWQTLLESIVVNPQQSLSRLPLLAEAEREQLLVKWNETNAASSAGQCLHHLFESQLAQTPDAIAVTFEEEQLSYQELNQRANQLAHHLQMLGVGPEVLVGLCLERSLEMIIGLLGVLKAGGAYVPLDPTYPSARLAFIVRDAQLSVLLTQRSLRARLAVRGPKIVYLDTDWQQIAQKGSTNPVSEVQQEHLAYVIYTSGSTGQPKGVLVRHQGVCNTLIFSRSHIDIGPADRLLQLASLSFDASVLELFFAWLNGASISLISPQTLRVGDSLAHLLRFHAITTLILPPSQLDTIPAGDFPGLRTIIVGAEACSAQTVARWAPGRHFFNVYAPTESSIYATLQRCQAPSELAPPVGRPIANMQVYLLDAHLQPVPIGVPAEIYLGGVGVARGYLNRADLTAERFVPHPFSQEAGVCLYRTGDLARYHSDGVIEFLGRTDQQVKLRGYRIEPGEIETVLREYLEIEEVAVLVQEDRAGNKRLVAYFVPALQRPLSFESLHGYLKEQLPDYMVPSAFVQLEALPLTPNGKLDRQVLATLEGVELKREGAYEGPRDPVEEVLAAMWADMLRLERVSIHDDFFELGGHSLLATRLISRVREAFQAELPLRSLFEMPTVAHQAALLLQTPGERARIERTAQLLMQLVRLSEYDVETILDETI